MAALPHPCLEADHQPLVPGEVYELDIEIWPTCIVVPPGYRIGFSVRGRDYEYGGDTSGLMLSNFKNELRGCGPFLHNDPRDRPPEIFENEVTLHFSPDRPQPRPGPGDPAGLRWRPGGTAQPDACVPPSMGTTVPVM